MFFYEFVDDLKNGKDITLNIGKHKSDGVG